MGTCILHLPVSGFLVGAKEGRREEEEEEIRWLRFGRFFGREVRVFWTGMIDVFRLG